MFSFINNFYKLRNIFFLVTLILYLTILGVLHNFKLVEPSGMALVIILFIMTLLFFNILFTRYSQEIDKHVKKIERTFVENIPKGVMITNKYGVIEYVNQHFEEITKYTKNDAIGQKPSLLKSGHHTQKFYKKLWNKLENEGYYFGEILNRKKNGEIYSERVTIAAIYENEVIDSYIAIFSDVSEEKEILQKLTEEKERFKQKANTDYLTNLYNRNKFSNILEYEYKKFQRTQESFCLVFIDIDHFKNINDSYGHGVGDDVLVEFSQLISESIRKSDTLARWGGEEFVLLLSQTEILEAEILAEKVRKRIEEHVFPTIKKLTASMGLVQCHNGADVITLLKKADKALYEAKAKGRNKVIVTK